MDILGLLTGALAGGAASSAGNALGGLLSKPFEDIFRGGAGLLGLDDRLTAPAIPAGRGAAATPGTDTTSLSPVPAAPPAPTGSGYNWGALTQAFGQMASTLAEASQKNYGTLNGIGIAAGAGTKGYADALKEQAAIDYTKAQGVEAKAKAAQAALPGAGYGDSVDAGAIRTRAQQILAATPNPTGAQVQAALTQAYNEVDGGKVDNYTDAGGNVHSQRRDLLPGAANSAPAAPTLQNSLPATPQDGNQGPGGLPALPADVLTPPAGRAAELAPKAVVAGQETSARNFADRVKDLQASNGAIQSTLTNLTQAQQLSPEAMQQGAILSIDQQKQLARRFQTNDNQRSLAAQAALESIIMLSIGPVLSQLAGPGGVRAEEVEQLRDRMGNAPTMAERNAIMAPYVDRLKNKLAYQDWQTTLMSRNIQPSEDMKARWFEQTKVQPDSFLPLGKSAADYLPAAPASTPAPAGREAAPTTPAQIYAPKSATDYAKVPSGAQYRGPDGKLRIKR